MDPAAQYALAYALTTTAGIRAFLSLAAMAIAVHVHLVHPPQAFAWLGSPGAMWSLIALAGIELLADKIPLIDHAMHVLQFVLKPAAAAILVGGAVHAPSHEVLVTLMVLGALDALGIHGAIASMRGASTVTTAGFANPVLSTVEDAGTIGSLFLAFLAPFVAVGVAIVFTVAIVVAARGAYRRLA